MTRLLACIDASVYATSVVDHAAWAARRLAAAVEVLHVIQRKDAAAARNDLSGAVGLGAKSALLEELARIDEAEGRLAQERGRALLAAAGDRLMAAGVADIMTTHRHGGIVETVIEREGDAALVVIGKRGASADFAQGHLGSKVERVVRQSVRPVLVASRTFVEPAQVVIAFDGGPSARKSVAFVASSPLCAGLGIHVVMSGSRCNDDYLAWARQALREHRDVKITFVSGEPAETIHAYLHARPHSLLVMGAYGHSPLRALLVGSTTTEMIRACRSPVLLFR
ncbi:universal stress protein [Parapedomonas caeni]